MFIVEHLSKTYADGTHALADVSLKVADGEILALVGGSGCGKTTLLRLVAGLDQATAGQISVDNEVIVAPHPFVGIGTAEITSTVASQLSLPVQQGLLVQSVEPSSAAAQAGLRAGSQQQQAGARSVATGGDIITAVDGQPVKRPEDFIAYLELQKRAGDALTLTILRDNQQQDVNLTLGQRPVTQAQSQPTPRQPGR